MSMGRKQQRKGLERNRELTVLLPVTLLCILLSACGQDSLGDASKEGDIAWEEATQSGMQDKNTDVASDEVCKWEEIQLVDTMKNRYANQFQIDFYENDYTLITITDTGRYLMIPEGKSVPTGLDEDITVIPKNPQKIYLAATSAMDLFRALDGIGNIRLSGTKENGWYLEEAREAMEQGNMIYAGKYSAPDYELILQEGCDLAIESTMLLRVPEVKEQLEQAGIPVLIDHSSYETEPMGRVEWVKLYGVLLGKQQEAEAFFDKQVEALDEIQLEAVGDKTIAFFYVTPNGSVNVRKNGDYVVKMIQMAGGFYALTDLDEEDNALSTMTIQMESFYNQAKDADYLIYNSAIDGEITTLDQLCAKSELFRDFKAVKNGDVWCTGKDMFQSCTGTADMILDFNKILNQENVRDEELRFLFRLQ